jgi:sortase A
MNKSRRLIEKSFLLAGVVCLGIWVWSVVSPAVFQDWESWVFDRKARVEESTVAEYLAERSGRIAADVRAWLGFPAAPEPSMPHPYLGPRVGPPFLDKDGLVGRLTIPRLHLRAMVREGADENTLGLALGHIPGTAFPGQKGNVGVAGHRDTLFRGLREIHKDDTIQFETLTGNYAYQVEDVEVVKPQNVSVLNPHEYAELTLVTCYPFNYIGSAPERFIVTARQVPLSQTEQEVTETPQQTAVERKPGIQRMTFEVSKNHSQQLSPGISLGVTGIEPADLRVNGWIWLMPDRRTIWLRDHSAHEPVVFYGYQDGKRRELVITRVTKNSITGYVLVPRVA